MHILSMFLYSKLAFGSELKKKIPTRFPKINESFFLGICFIFGNLFLFLGFYFLFFKYIIVFFCFFPNA